MIDRRRTASSTTQLAKSTSLSSYLSSSSTSIVNDLDSTDETSANKSKAQRTRIVRSAHTMSYSQASDNLSQTACYGSRSGRTPSHVSSVHTDAWKSPSSKRTDSSARFVPGNSRQLGGGTSHAARRHSSPAPARLLVPLQTFDEVMQEIGALASESMPPEAYPAQIFLSDEYPPAQRQQHSTSRRGTRRATDPGPRQRQ